VHSSDLDCFNTAAVLLTWAGRLVMHSCQALDTCMHCCSAVTAAGCVRTWWWWQHAGWQQVGWRGPRGRRQDATSRWRGPWGRRQHGVATGCCSCCGGRPWRRRQHTCRQCRSVDKSHRAGSGRSNDWSLPLCERMPAATTPRCVPLPRNVWNQVGALEAHLLGQVLLVTAAAWEAAAALA
jgi:hypothetical protein